MFQPYAIEQRIILATGALQNYVVIQLPGGKETRAPIDLETTKQLLEGAPMSEVRTQPVTPPPEALAPPPPPPPAPEPEHAPEPDTGEEPVEWASLPDEVMHPLMKAALVRLNVAPILPVSNLTSLVEQINERFSQEDWQELQAAQASPPAPAPAPAPPAEEPPPPAPVISGIRWADGRPIVPGLMNRGRTVQKDEMGYPVAQDGEVDPGEIVGGMDTDEDGVGQL